MAFLNRARSLLKAAVGNKISISDASVLQSVRWMSSSKLFIGGLSYNTDDTGLSEAFGQYGEVVEARIISDRDTGRSRGFGFVTYTSTDSASSAIQALDGQDLHGRRIRVNYAMERSERGGGFGGSNYGRGGYPSGGYGSGFGGSGFGNDASDNNITASGFNFSGNEKKRGLGSNREGEESEEGSEEEYADDIEDEDEDDEENRAGKK